MDFLFGGVAAVGAGCFSNPFEVLKTRMQLQGELTREGQYQRTYRNAVDAGWKIIKKDGVLGLQKGLTPALWVQFISNGAKLGIYRTCEEHGLVQDENGHSDYFRIAAIGGASGVMGHLLSTPFYLVKTLLQSPPGCKTTGGHSHEGMWNVLTGICKKHGLKGLYRGAGGSVPRAFVGTTGQLTAFKMCKESLAELDYFTEKPFLTTFAASMIGGAAISATTTPFDLIMIRLYHQPIDSTGKGQLYNGYVDCVMKIFRNEGPTAFYKGAGPLYLRLGPHSVLCLVFWDELKSWHEKYSPTRTIEYFKLYN